jgi:hypothetical protein
MALHSRDRDSPGNIRSRAGAAIGKSEMPMSEPEVHAEIRDVMKQTGLDYDAANVRAFSSPREARAEKRRGGGVISAARLAANRRNAQRSTGPKTPAGKARSARNARKHGLSVPVWHDRNAAPAIAALAAAIAGKDASPERLAHAEAIAAANCAAVRCRNARRALMAMDVTTPQLVDKLYAIERYEARAHARRRRAVRNFDEEGFRETKQTLAVAARAISPNEAKHAGSGETPPNEAKDAAAAKIPPNEAKEANSSRLRGVFQTRPAWRPRNPAVSHRRTFECRTIRNSRCSSSRYRSPWSMISFPPTRNSKRGLYRYSGLRGPPDRIRCSLVRLRAS